MWFKCCDVAYHKNILFRIKFRKNKNVVIKSY